MSSNLVSLRLWLIVLPGSSAPLPIPIQYVHSDLDPRNNLELVIDISVQGIHKMLDFSNKHCMNTRSKIGVLKLRSFHVSLILP